MKWDLNELPELTECETNLSQSINDIDQEIKKITSKNYISQTKKVIEKSEEIFTLLNALYAKAMLKESLDVDDIEASTNKSKLKNQIMALEDVQRPFWHFLKGIYSSNGFQLDDQSAVELFKNFPELYYYLTRSRDLAKHNLSTDQETILSRKDMIAIMGLNDLRSKIELGQEYEITIGKKKKKINNLSELSRYFFNKDSQLRRSAYDSLYSQVAKNLSSYFTIYEAIVKDWKYEAELRKYSSSISVRNVSNDVSDQTVKSLINSVVNSRGIFQEYFKLKAKYLGIKKMSRYDIYTSVDGNDTNVSYDKALKIVMAAFKEFDLDFYNKANAIIASKHLDLLPMPKKANGAFCLPIAPQYTPYVMLNFTGTQRDVLVMAHELGHAMHSLFSAKRSYYTYDAPLTLAETASTFSELLVFESLLQSAKSNKEKIVLIFDKLSDIYATIIRQIYFVRFEIQAHELLPQGSNMNELSATYYELLTEQFGDAITIPKEFGMEWANIPHIVRSPFYCYAYAFGELLAIALYEEYKSDGKEFKVKIKNILEAGSKENPEQLLLKNGIDIGNDKFWLKGFQYVTELLEQLKTLIK